MHREVVSIVHRETEQKIACSQCMLLVRVFRITWLYRSGPKSFYRPTEVCHFSIPVHVKHHLV